jgi:pimeloyl-ACP methyl ester carboxylesterase
MFMNVARAAVRPETYAAQVREATSLAITATMWPFGWVDRGVTELRSKAAADGSPVKTPVLLVHGYGANKSNWLFLDRQLRHTGFERIHALNYNPLRETVPEIAGRCTLRARELMEHFGTDRVHLIGHSCGGVVVRYAVQLSGLEGVDTCVTIAAPHQGSPLAKLAPCATARSLAPDSALLRRLHGSARHLPTRFVAYYSNVDVLVPGRRAMILEPALAATNVLVRDEGHLSIMLSRRMASSVAGQLAAAEGLPGYGTPVRRLPAVEAVDSSWPPGHPQACG